MDSKICFHIFFCVVTLLDGVATTGMVEVGDHNLASYLAETKSGGQPFFRKG